MARHTPLSLSFLKNSLINNWLKVVEGKTVFAKNVYQRRKQFKNLHFWNISERYNLLDSQIDLSCIQPKQVEAVNKPKETGALLSQQR